MTVKQVRYGALDRCHIQQQSQAVDDCHPIRKRALPVRKAPRWPDETTGKPVAIVRTWLTTCEYLNLMPYRVGIAVQFQGRMIGDDAARAQTGGGQEAVYGPTLRPGMFWNGRKYLARYSPDVARFKMLCEHCRNDLVAAVSTDRVSVFGTPKYRV